MTIIDLDDEHRGSSPPASRTGRTTFARPVTAARTGWSVPSPRACGQAGSRRAWGGRWNDPVPTHRAVDRPRRRALLHPCIWVHGHKQGRGNFQGHGMGSALLDAAEADARALGAKGLAAWGLWLPFWMKASWFKRHGYRKADRQGIAVLLWKPFTGDAQPPRWYPGARSSLTQYPERST